MGNLRRWPMLHQDWFSAAVLLCVVGVFAALIVDFHRPPFEDAAMLMRYAENLAHGHGIVWNIGERPVDGATDFLFMSGVAGLIKLGLPTGRSVRILGLGAHVLTVLLVYSANRRLSGASPFLSLLSGLFIAVGAGLWYVAAFFGTTFFAFCAALTWFLALTLIGQKRPANWIMWCFAGSALLTGLARPEGVLLAIFMLFSILLARRFRESGGIVWRFILVMALAGGAYFAWHWQYFGHPLPNPYYKKGAGVLHWDSLWESMRYLLLFGGPFAVAYLVGLRSAIASRITIVHVMPVILFGACFVLVSNETNFGGRFQYAVAPMIMMSYFPLVKGAFSEAGFGRRKTAGPMDSRLAAVLSIGAIAIVIAAGTAQGCMRDPARGSCARGYTADGRYDVAQRLAAYRNRGYVIATSEAGLLPLYSGWSAIDTWGLNDAWIAQHGEVTAEYLDEHKPDLIVFHSYFSPLVPAGRSKNDLENAWHRMTLVLQTYAVSHDYVLAAAFGDSPAEAHYYYVRPGLADGDAIARDIAHTMPYYWFSTGKRAVNYARLTP